MHRPGVVAVASQSPAGQIRVWATRYHEDPPSIDRMRAELTQAVAADPSVDNLVALAEVCFIWGDVRAKTTDDLEPVRVAAFDLDGRRSQRQPQFGQPTQREFEASRQNAVPECRI